MPEPRKILVIKLSSLGDFVQALGAFKAIRNYHGHDRLILLTTKPYVEPARGCGLFDEIWLDERPVWWRPDRWLRYRKRLRAAGIWRVYDLQRQDRTGWYFRLFRPRPPEWVGIVDGCSHRYIDPPRPMHIMERHKEMLALAGIEEVPAPDLSFMAAEVGRFALVAPFALLVPGSSPHRLVKRWPGESFIELARDLDGEGITPVLIGGAPEQDLIRSISAACPAARQVTTSLGELVGLAQGACVAVGNDTGPIHLIAAAGCPVVALFSRESHPVKARPAGPSVVVLQSARIADLPVSEVLGAIDRIKVRD